MVLVGEQQEPVRQVDVLAARDTRSHHSRSASPTGTRSSSSPCTTSSGVRIASAYALGLLRALISGVISRIQ